MEYRMLKGHGFIMEDSGVVWHWTLRRAVLPTKARLVCTKTAVGLNLAAAVPVLQISLFMDISLWLNYRSCPQPVHQWNMVHNAAQFNGGSSDGHSFYYRDNDIVPISPTYPGMLVPDRTSADNST